MSYMRSWKGAWLHNGTRGYRKLGLKDAQDFKERSHETARQDLLTLQTYHAKRLGGADSAPPPPSLFRVKRLVSYSFSVFSP